MKHGVYGFMALLLASGTLAQTDRDVRELRDWMTGYFSSQEQSLRDSAFLDIRLTIHPIWQHRPDGYWLYVEQADARTPEQPYRQRIYRLTLTARGIESIIYTFNNPLPFAGKPEKVERELKEEHLVQRIGCEVVLKRQDDGTFAGSTVGKNCPSELRGAAYATSTAIITRDKMITHDRGFDAHDNQVWGSRKGGYEFKKIRP